MTQKQRGRRQPEIEFKRKAHLDLWLHQNNLLWSRIQTLYLLQGAFFGAVYFVKSSGQLTAIVCVIMLILMIILYDTMENDRKFRTYHRAELTKYGFDPLPSGMGLPKLVRKYLTDEQFEQIFHIGLTGLFAIADVIAVYAFYNS